MMNYKILSSMLTQDFYSFSEEADRIIPLKIFLSGNFPNIPPPLCFFCTRLTAAAKGFFFWNTKGGIFAAYVI